MARAKITSKGQITIPKAVRERLGVGPGDSLEFMFQDGKLEVEPVRRRSIMEFAGLFKVADPPPWKGWAHERRIAWEAMTRRLVAPDQGSDG